MPQGHDGAFAETDGHTSGRADGQACGGADGDGDARTRAHGRAPGRSGLPGGKLLVISAAFGLLLLSAAVAVVQNVTGGSGSGRAPRPGRSSRRHRLKKKSSSHRAPSLGNMDELIAGLSHKSMDVRFKAAGAEQGDSHRQECGEAAGSVLKEPGKARARGRSASWRQGAWPS